MSNAHNSAIGMLSALRDALAFEIGWLYPCADRFPSNPAAAFFDAFTFNYYPSDSITMTEKIIG
jgi:hypothetical protein